MIFHLLMLNFEVIHDDERVQNILYFLHLIISIFLEGPQYLFYAITSIFNSSFFIVCNNVILFQESFTEIRKGEKFGAHHFGSLSLFLGYTIRAFLRILLVVVLRTARRCEMKKMTNLWI